MNLGYVRFMDAQLYNVYLYDPTVPALVPVQGNRRQRFSFWSIPKYWQDFRWAVGMIYIKIVMLLFMDVPILGFFVGISNPTLSVICYLVPSQATFEGIMDLADSGMTTADKDIVILAVHCVVWFLGYLIIFKRPKNRLL